MESPVYIIGHRNPDADSICSAIGYTALKHELGRHECVAARCGNPNARIDTILNRFKVPLPVFVGDVTPRVRDIMVTDAHCVRIDSTCAEALELIDRHDVRALPVISSHARPELLGTVSIFQLGEYFVPKPKDTKAMRHVCTSIDAIVRSLHADVIHLSNSDKVEDMYVRVGAMDIRSFNNFATRDIPANQSIIVVGDRYDIQQKSIQMGVRLLVISGGLELDEEVIHMARERNVSLIVSSYDSASTAVIIRSAMSVRNLMQAQPKSFSPEEKLSLVRHKTMQSNTPIYHVVDENGVLLGIFSKSDLLKPVSKKLILVDHNELSQAVTGAEELEIVEIIDHHRLGNPPTRQPILFINEPVGSTSTIVAEMFRRYGKTPAPDIAGVLMGGMIADTLHLQSPTTTERDREVLQWLSTIAGVSSDELSEIIFSSGSIILSQQPEDVVRSDMKRYDESGLTFSISQVEELGFTNFWNHAEQLSAALAKVRDQEALSFSGLLVTDINSQNSLFLFVGPDEIREQIHYTEVQHNTFDMPGVVSRKKQLMPYITQIIQSSGV